MKNKVQLITYVDRFGGKTLSDLKELLTGPLGDLFGGVHLLPFYYPIDGTDAGFDPEDHTRVDPRLGDWEDIRRLSESHDIIADVIVNHVSAGSPQFMDYREHGSESEFSSMFLSMGDVFPGGATEEMLLKIYRPRPGLPFTPFAFGDGKNRLMWTTFTSNQIDINVADIQGEKYLDSILIRFANSGIKLIRLDAAGYAVKKPGTSCFMIQDTFDFIRDFTDKSRALGMEVLVEVHAHHLTQIDIASKVDYVYDFALPPLILHAIYRKTSQYLKKWLEMAPKNAITVLDTHDGIGVIDVGAEGSRHGLLESEEIDYLVEEIHRRSQGQSRMATGAAASNLDLYQLNCTYFDALGRDENAYLIARLIQFFVPGIPQVYYVGLLAGQNDMELLGETGVGRDINRHYYKRSEVLSRLKSTVVQRLIKAIRFRNRHPAFNGEFQLLESGEKKLFLKWIYEHTFAELYVDLDELEYRLRYEEGGEQKFIQDF